MKRKCNIKLTKIENINDINLNQYAKYLQELLDYFPKKYKDKAINEVTSSGNANYKSMIKLAIDYMTEDCMNECLNEKTINKNKKEKYDYANSIKYFIENFDSFGYAKSETDRIYNFFINSEYEDYIKIIFKCKNSIALDLLIVYTIALYTLIIDKIINIIENAVNLNNSIKFNKPILQNILNDRNL